MHEVVVTCGQGGRADLETSCNYNRV